jgi:formylglycine-generating enzyme required for sulfatase activity
MQRHEVTQAAFQALMSWNPSLYQNDEEQRPVENVTWFDAILYSNKLSRNAGLPTCYEATDLRCSGPDPKPDSSEEDACARLGLHTVSALVKLPAGIARHDLCPGYRLPTEAEWEYAARAGTLAPSNPADLPLVQLAWFSEPSRLLNSPAEVAGLLPNDHHLFDMLGNLEEWVWDPYQIFEMSETVCDRSGDYCPSIDPPNSYPQANSENLLRVIKGGSWRSPGPSQVRAGARSPSNPGVPGDNRGFRLVRTLLFDPSQE